MKPFLSPFFFVLSALGMEKTRTFFDNPQTYLYQLPVPLKNRIVQYATHNSTIKQKILVHAPLEIQNEIYTYKDNPWLSCHHNKFSKTRDPHTHCYFIVKRGSDLIDMAVARDSFQIKYSQYVQGIFSGADLLHNGQLLIKGTDGNTFIDMKTKNIIKKISGKYELSDDLTKLTCFADESKKTVVIKDASNNEPIHYFHYRYQCNKNPEHFDEQGEHMDYPRFNKDGTHMVLEFNGFSYAAHPVYGGTTGHHERSVEIIPITEILKLEKKLNTTLEPIELVLLESIYNRLQKKDISTSRKYIKQRLKRFSEKSPYILQAFLAIRQSIRINDAQ